jgi:hypothetical protein
MADVTLKIERDSYINMTTLGKWYGIKGEYLCETLEDIVRGWGIKHAKTTAIPCTSKDKKYRMTVSYSGKFKRRMIMIYTEDNKYELKMNGISFKGIRAHGGKNNLNTWGCVCVSLTRTGPETLGASCEDMLTAYVDNLEKQGHKVWLEVKNLPQAQ